MTQDIGYFSARSEVAPDTGCWEWGRAKNNDGYGVCRHKGAARLAHRVAFALARGVEERDLKFVCHHCDNPGCVNPLHLFEGDAAANNADKTKKDRVPFGDGHWRSKLSDGDVLEIRQRTRTGENHTAIGALFGVAASVVSEIGAGAAWSRA